jgi:hypothetical protein
MQRYASLFELKALLLLVCAGPAIEVYLKRIFSMS